MLPTIRRRLGFWFAPVAGLDERGRGAGRERRDRGRADHANDRRGSRRRHREDAERVDGSAGGAGTGSCRDGPTGSTMSDKPTGNTTPAPAPGGPGRRPVTERPQRPSSGCFPNLAWRRGKDTNNWSLPRARGPRVPHLKGSC